MAANIIIREVSISPNPVNTGAKYKISISAEEMSNFAFVDSCVGSYVNSMAKELPNKLALAYVGESTKA